MEIPLISGWNIVFIQWKDGGDFAGYIMDMINKVTKKFVTSIPKHYDLGIYIGGQKNGHNFNSSICAFDFTSQRKSYLELPTNIPSEIRDLLMSDHFNRIR